MSDCFPAFGAPFLKSLNACTCFPLTASPLSKLILELGAKTETREARFESASGPTWIRVRADRLGEGPEDIQRGRFRIDSKLEAAIAARITRKPKDNPDDVQELLEMLAAERAGRACFEGNFSIPKDNLPKRGVVELMLDVSAVVGNTAMTVSGATFEIHERPPYDRLSWKLKTDADGSVKLDVNIFASMRLDSMGGSLVEAEKVLSAGAQELVIEATSEEGGKA